MSSPLVLAVASLLAEVLPHEVELNAAGVAEQLAPPPNATMGDFAFPCFKFAKILRKSPKIIAEELAAALPTGDLLAEASAAGPYVNLRLSVAASAQQVLPRWLDGVGAERRPKGERVMIEYSQPNTHKAFHVGHLRNVCLGDSLVRLLRTVGYDVVAANYLGDVGAHIAKCLWWYLDMLSDEERQPPAEAKGEWLGECYSKAAIQLEDWDKAKDDATAQEKLAAAKARTTEILQKLEARDPELTAIWEQTRKWSLDDFDAIYAWSGVHFDRIFYESEVDEPGLRLVEEYLQKGVFRLSEGAVGIDNPEIEYMPFFMLRKKDGTSLYSTKDLALAKLKFNEYAVDRSIYVVDHRQSDHFRHVFLTLQKMGFEQAEKCVHVPYEMVDLPGGAMSSRKGTVVLFRRLREQMEGALREQHFAKYQGEWDDAEIAEKCHQVALGAIKYGMLQRDVSQKIVFDMDEWLRFEGNTGPYVQYVAARTASILRKAEERDKGLQPGAAADAFAALGEAAEGRLILALDRLDDVVKRAAEQLRPSILCAELFSLAKAYNRFQSECDVIHSEGQLLQGRLRLVQATRRALEWGLDLLGIPAPERM